MPLLISLFIFLVILGFGNSQSCSSNAVCTGGKICLNYSCQKCFLDHDCAQATPSTPYCLKGPVNSANFCVQCVSSTQCTSAANSLCSSNVCTSCSVDGDCSHISGGKKKCLSGQCVECTSTADCTNGICNTTINQCYGPTCTSSANCVSTPSLPYCLGTCQSCGVYPSFCTSSGLVCTPQGFCAQCAADTDCTSSTKSQCVGTTCSVCSSDTNCAHISGKPYCLAGTGCVQCTSAQQCSPGSTCTNHMCVANPDIVITLATTTSPYDYLITFPVQLVSGVDVTSGITLSLLNVNPSAYSYTITEQSQTVYDIHFTVTQSIQPTTLSLSYTYHFTNGATSSSQIWVAQVTSKRMAFMPPGQINTIHAIKSVGATSVTAVTSTMGVMILFGGNPVLLWAMIGLLQTFYYMIFINVNYPANVQYFLQIFTLGNFNFIPNPIEWFDSDINNENVATPERFEEYDVNGLFLENAGNMLLVWVAIFVIYCVSFVVKRFLNRLSRLMTYISYKTVYWFEWSGVLRALITSYPELSQAAFLQARAITTDSASYTISSIFGVIFSIYGAAFPIITFFMIRKFSKNPRLMKRKYEALIEEYKTDGAIPKYFTPIFLLKRLFINLTLVFLHDHPYVEMSVMMLLNVTILLLQIKFKPFETRCGNIVNTSNEALFLIVHVLIFVLVNDDYTTKFSDEKRIEIGWGIIAICAVICILSVGLAIAEVLFVIKQMWELVKRISGKPDKSKQKKALAITRKSKHHGIMPLDFVDLGDIIPSDTSSTTLNNLSIATASTVYPVEYAPKRRRVDKMDDLRQSHMIDHMPRMSSLPPSENTES